MTKKQMTQSEINKLLNDSQDLDDSSFHPVQIKVTEPKPKQIFQQSNAYKNQQFDDYEQSRQTKNIQKSQQSIQILKDKKQGQKNRFLQQIKQQGQKKQNLTAKASNKGPDNYIRPALQLGNQSNFNKKQQAFKMPVAKNNLAYNYARLQERQRQLLLTTLSQQNKRLKNQLLQKQNLSKKLQQKYKNLLQQKTENTSTAKQLILQKKIKNLETRLEQMSNLKKIQEDRQKYKSKISKDPGIFIPKQQSDRRQAQLVDLIEKLKTRLLQSDQNMGVLRKKINEGAQYNDEMHRKMKRVQQLEYKIEKMTEQAQTDRGYIEILKQKVKQLQRLVQCEKSKNRKQQIEIKRMEMSQFTHSDILKQLQQVKKQKQLLEKSLKEMSSTMMANVRNNYKPNNKNDIQDSEQLLKVTKK